MKIGCLFHSIDHGNLNYKRGGKGKREKGMGKVGRKERGGKREKEGEKKGGEGRRG